MSRNSSSACTEPPRNLSTWSSACRKWPILLSRVRKKTLFSNRISHVSPASCHQVNDCLQCLSTPDLLRDSDRTKSAILLAAQQAFSARGYGATGVRHITSAAGVNGSLVSRYFGSKEKLFEAALSELLDASVITNIDKANFGKDIVALFTQGDGDRVNVLPMLVLAAGDPVSRAIADRLLRALVIKPLTSWFERDHAEERAARLVLLASGFFLYRIIYALPAWEGELAPASCAWLERTFQSVVDDLE
jgi:AcrR family transcriptional regulator